ncbi:hypothetical protein [Pseudonocardia sp.]|uniref:hypothetical protein n=1 Tax=Pseudonocardia sp. TaxID=60912 RepID=UPI003D10420C
MTSTATNPTTVSDQLGPVITSNVLAVVMRVAGPVTTGVAPYGLGTPERQVTVRIGDAVVFLRDRRTAARVRQQWDAGVGMALQLRRRVSQTWLHPRPGTYPVAVSVQLTEHVKVLTVFVPGNLEKRRPDHVRVQVDQLVWEICDIEAWRTIGDAWLTAQQYLER